MSEEMKQIEWVEEPYTMIGKDKMYPGDKSTLPKFEADQYVAAGWAKDETGKMGERKPGAVAMKVNDVQQEIV